MRGQRDEGAVAVTVALLLVVFFLLAGFVVDIGLARFDRVQSQTKADLAATAASRFIDDGAVDAYETACLAAVDYFRANTPGAAPVTGAPCAVFADANFTCASTTAATTAVVDLEPYRLVITVPVHDADPLLAGQAINREVDGFDPCSRIGVRIERSRQHLFAGVGGFDDVTSVSDAVARSTADGNNPEYATLVILDPHGCGVITLNGNGTAVVIEDLDENVSGDLNGDGELEVFPGIVTIDSDAGDGPCYLLSPSANNSRICAGVAEATADAIFSAPNAPSRPACDSSPDTLLVEASPTTVADPSYYAPPKPQVDPYPAQRGRITRQPIDHRYNCIGDYYSPGYADALGRRQYPVNVSASDTDVEPCGDSATRRGHIDDLIAAYRRPGVSPSPGFDRAAALAAGFTVIAPPAAAPGPAPPNPCKPSAPIQYPAGNYYVDCTGSQGFVIGNSAVVDFVGPGTIVFAGDVTVKGTLLINSSDTGDTIVYLQDGDLDDTGGVRTDLRRTFVYFEHGIINLKNDVVWEAPRDNAYDDLDDDGTVVTPGVCDYDVSVGDVPQPGCFENLASWTNSRRTHDLGGGAVFELDGIFFSPNAGSYSGTEWFKLHGGPGYRLEHAQFFTYSLLLDGGSVLTMRPDPDRFEATPIIGGGLIR